MIGIMDKAEINCADEEEETTPSKSTKKIQTPTNTPSITSFFKPSSKPVSKISDTNPSDLRSYFQVTSKKLSLLDSSGKGVKSENGVTSGEKKVEKDEALVRKKRSKKGDDVGEENQTKSKKGVKGGKKRKKQEVDADHSSAEDFESPPQPRRKRKARLGSETVEDMARDDEGKKITDECLRDAADKVKETSSVRSAEINGDLNACNGEMDGDILNSNNVVSYEDFLNASMADDDSVDEDEEEDICIHGDGTRNAGEKVNGVPPSSPKEGQGVPQETLDSVMLTPPDSRCSQEMSDADHTPSRELENFNNKKESGERKEETEAKDTTEVELPPRKVITIKAQVHSPFDGQGKEISPTTTLDSQNESKLTPRRLLSNVCVPDSSPEFTTILVEKREEERKILVPGFREEKKCTGPVYSIFQKKSAKKDDTKEKATSAIEHPKDESVKKEINEKDVTGAKKGKKDSDAVETPGGDEKTKDSKEDKSDKKIKKSNTQGSEGASKDDTADNREEMVDGDKSKPQLTSKEDIKPEAKRDNEVKDEDKFDNPSPRPTKRVLRTRTAKKSLSELPDDLDSSIAEFEETGPPTVKPKKPTKESQKAKNKSTLKKNAKGGKPTDGPASRKMTQEKATPQKKTGGEMSDTPKKFKSAIVSNGKGQGSIKLRLTAIKVSPKKNNKVAKAHQLLQKAKAGPPKSKPVSKKMSQTTLRLGGAVTAPKNGQQTLGAGKRKATYIGVKKVGKANVMEKGVQSRIVGVKKSDDGTKSATPGKSRRSSSRLKPKTPPKPAAKLAPIFTLQGKLAAAKKFKQDDIRAAMATTENSIMSLDEASRESFGNSQDGFGFGEQIGTSLPSLGFNMLERLKAGPETTADTPNFMPFPEVSHVLQKDNEDTNWNLPQPVFSSWKLAPLPEICRLPIQKSSVPIQLGSVSFCNSSQRSSFNFKAFSGHPPLSEPDQKTVIEDIIRTSEKFPARKIFKMYQAKKAGETSKKENTKSEKTNEAKTTTSKTGSEATGGQDAKVESKKVTRGKRKADELATGEESGSRKMACTEGRGRRSTRRSLEMGSDTGVAAGDGDAKDQEAGRSLRRSTRRRSRRISLEEEEEKKESEMKEEKEAKKEEKVAVDKSEVSNAEDQAARRRAGMPWTEKYQPTKFTEMIGNTAVCRKFHSWLTEWKKKAERMKEKTKRGERQHKVSKGSKKDDSDDSDDNFFCSDSDDSDEEDGLCNTTLLLGPHGVGKTALVYACAQELGYEVFEVNASSRRNGRQILSELGEVTQSHQVARQPGMSFSSFFKASPTKSAAKNASPKKKKPPIPKAFAAFFKAGAKESNPTKRSPVKKPRSPKKQVKKPLQTAPVPQSVGLPGASSGNTKSKLSSASLILFDEVDIIFEEDKGFLAAVTSFMENAKRPIVLTTTDPRFAYALSNRFDELALKHPPLTSLTNHLQLICLAENVPTSHSEMKKVVQFFGRDVRQCLQNLQFWALSGAMPLQTDSLRATSACAVGRQNVDSQRSSIQDKHHVGSHICSVIGNAMDAADVKDVVNSNGVKSTNCDESTVNGPTRDSTGAVSGNVDRPHSNNATHITGAHVIPKPCCAKDDNDGQKVSDVTGIKPNGAANETKTSCHCGALESIVGLGNVAGPVTNVLHLLKQFDKLNMDSQTKGGLLQAFHELGIDVSHHNIPHILSSLKFTQESTSNTPCAKGPKVCVNNSKVTAATNKQIQEPNSVEIDEESNTTIKDVKLIENQGKCDSSSSNGVDDVHQKLTSKLGADLIHSLAEHAETMSELDVRLPHRRRQRALLDRHGNQDWWHPLSFPGLDDNEDCVGADWEYLDARPYNYRSETNIAECNSWLEAASLTKCLKKCRHSVDVARTERSDDANFGTALEQVLPRSDGSLHLQQSDPGMNIRDTHQAVVRRLPDYLFCSHSTLALDYLPSLRAICRSEELRKEANLKRRFFHHLDGISMCLKPATYISLASMLNPDQTQIL